MDRLWLAPKGLHVEPGQPGDAETLARLHATGFYRGWPAADFASYLLEADISVYVACDAKRKIIGFALFRAVGDECELLTIVVDPRWRGKGIGAALLAAAVDDFRRSPVKRFFLEVEQENVAAIRLYQRFGFSRIGRREGYYALPNGQTAAALVMAADLE